MFCEQRDYAENVALIATRAVGLPEKLNDIYYELCLAY
jgi:hypothetical protein